MEDYKILYQLIRKALDAIPEEYLHTSYDLSFFNSIPSSRNFLEKEDELIRFGERVFCYEFYHQLRNHIDDFRRIEPNFFSHFFLEGEVKKIQMMDLLENLNLKHLDASYSPDLLFHQPGNANNAYVIEVKVNPNLTELEVLYDIEKLIQFVDRYNYQKGLFVCNNNDPERILNIIRDTELFFIPVKRLTTEDVTNNIALLLRPMISGNYEEFNLTKILR